MMCNFEGFCSEHIQLFPGGEAKSRKFNAFLIAYLMF